MSQCLFCHQADQHRLSLDSVEITGPGLPSSCYAALRRTQRDKPRQAALRKFAPASKQNQSMRSCSVAVELRDLAAVLGRDGDASGGCRFPRKLKSADYDYDRMFCVLLI